MLDIFHILRARNMINNKRYFQKAQKLFEWNELMYSGQSKAKLARTGILREYS